MDPIDRTDRTGRTGRTGTSHLDDPQELGVAFWAQAHGFATSEEPPPGSPLARVRAFTAEHGSEVLGPRHIQAAIEGRPLLP
ncbi:hypothetical protein ACWCPT_20225 [Streptomyces sp. NPDC002308]